MATVSLSKVSPIKKIDPHTITINDNEVIVIQYLPIQKKLALIEKVLNNTIDETGFLNPYRLQINFEIEVIRAYTNISITDKMMENPQNVYDALEINHVIENVIANIPEQEYSVLYNAMNESAEHAVAYLNSFVGMMRTVSADYKNTEMNVDKLMSDLGDPEKVGLVKDILDKIG